MRRWGAKMSAGFDIVSFWSAALSEFLFFLQMLDSSGGVPFGCHSQA